MLGGGLEYKPMSMTAVDAQLTDQDKRTSEMICAVYHVPASMVDSSHAPPYGNSETLLQQYYSQCLQTHMTGIENALDEGLELPTPYGTEFDVDDLIWMDTATRTKAAADAIGSGALSPNEARQKYFGLGPVPGGESPLAQQQYYSLAALAARDTAAPTPPTPAPDPDTRPARRRGGGKSVYRHADEGARGGVPMRPDVLAESLALSVKGLLRADCRGAGAGARDGRASSARRKRGRARSAGARTRPAGPAWTGGLAAPGARWERRGARACHTAACMSRGKAYDTGEIVTAGGSTFHCQPPDDGRPGQLARLAADGASAAGSRKARRARVMAALLVTIQTAKDHLQIPTMAPGDPDEADVRLKLDQAEAIILDYLADRADPSWTSPQTAPQPVTAAILLMLGRLYRHRGDLEEADADLWLAIDRLLKRYRDSAIA